MWKRLLCLTILTLLTTARDNNPWDWQVPDGFDVVNRKFESVNEENCWSRSLEQITMRDGTVSQLPKANQLLTQTWFPNRTALIHLHNMVLNRAFFYSYIMQKLDTTEEFYLQPGLRYLYMSAEADVAANSPYINGSGLFYDHNFTYPNWYITVPINQTLRLFGYNAFRADDYNEPSNWVREPTNNTFDIMDYAAGPGNDYTKISYKFNPWYNTWLPDTDFSDEKRFPYEVSIRHSNATGVFSKNRTKTIQGPPKPGSSLDSIVPVRWTKVWFDCGRSNKWVLTAAAPVYDFIARYVNWTHIRKYTNVAVTTMSIDLFAIDYNPCPASKGNPGPNVFFASDACDRPTTHCEPQSGFGYQKGNYWCWCKPGYRLPWWQDGPFQGPNLEEATLHEFDAGYRCEPVELTYKLPNVEQGADVIATGGQGIVTRTRRALAAGLQHAKRLGYGLYQNLRPVHHVNAVYQMGRDAVAAALARPAPPKVSRRKRDSFDPDAMDRAQRLLSRIADLSTDRKNCHSYPEETYYLPGDVAYGVKEQFEPQARTALRLANFLSNFLQNVDYNEDLGILRADKPLNEELLFGEVVANVMADAKILGAGVFFDQNKFVSYDTQTKQRVTREYFGAYAWTAAQDSGKKDSYKAVDLAGLPVHQLYSNQNWFKKQKFRWAVNQHGLERYTSRMWIRSDPAGESIAKYAHWPMWYRSADYHHGEWLEPQFKCDRMIDNWVVTYVVPFFGLNDIRTDIEFQGVVTVDVDLLELYINQCPGDFFTPNAFKNTARCHYENTYCRFYYLRKIKEGTTASGGSGNYQCHCKRGFEYPYQDTEWFFEGELIEKEYQKYTAGQRNRFNDFQCRLAAAVHLKASFLFVALFLLISVLF